MQLQVWLLELRNQVTFCLKVLLDLLSDISFSVINWKSKRLGVPPPEDDILLESALVLARKIRSRKLKSEALVQQCIDRIKEVNSLINAVVDNRFGDALREARECDKYLNSIVDDKLALTTLEECKPFYGVPFSTKEGIKVKGLHHSYGLVSRKDIVAIEDAEAVKLLKASGAIALCVTNVSELGSWWNSSNHVYGATNNPHNLAHCPGGSSGDFSSVGFYRGTEFAFVLFYLLSPKPTKRHPGKFLSPPSKETLFFYALYSWLSLFKFNLIYINPWVYQSS